MMRACVFALLILFISTSWSREDHPSIMESGLSFGLLSLIFFYNKKFSAYSGSDIMIHQPDERRCLNSGLLKVVHKKDGVSLNLWWYQPKDRRGCSRHLLSVIVPLENKYKLVDSPLSRLSSGNQAFSHCFKKDSDKYQCFLSVKPGRADFLFSGKDKSQTDAEDPLFERLYYLYPDGPINPVSVNQVWMMHHVPNIPTASPASEDHVDPVAFTFTESVRSPDSGYSDHTDSESISSNEQAGADYEEAMPLSPIAIFVNGVQHLQNCAAVAGPEGRAELEQIAWEQRLLVERTQNNSLNRIVQNLVQFQQINRISPALQNQLEQSFLDTYNHDDNFIRLNAMSLQTSEETVNGWIRLREQLYELQQLLGLSCNLKDLIQRFYTPPAI